MAYINNSNFNFEREISSDQQEIEFKDYTRHQKKIYEIISKYFKIAEFKVFSDLYEPTCAIILNPDSAKENFSSLDNELKEIGIFPQLSRFKKSQIKGGPILKDLKEKDPSILLYKLIMLTIYPKQAPTYSDGDIDKINNSNYDSTRSKNFKMFNWKNKSNIYHILSILLSIGTIALSAWWYFTKMDPVYAYQFHTKSDNINHTLYFVLGIFLIIFTHEMGHKIACDKNRIKAKLPIFIPGPPPIGVLGAYVSIKEKLKTRNNLFDVSISGLFAGFLCSLIIIIIGLSISVQMDTEDYLNLYATFADISKYDAADDLSAHLNSFNLLILGLKKIFFPDEISTGSFYNEILPVKIIILHPLAFAGWMGLLMTGLNIITVPPLDGGQVFHSMFPQSWGKLVGAIIGIVIFFSINSLMGYIAIFSLSIASVELSTENVDPSDITFPFEHLSKSRWVIGIILFMFIIILFPISRDSLIYPVSM